MKKTLFTLTFLFALLSAQENYAKNLIAYFSYNTFYSPADGPFVETYLAVNGASVQMKLNDKGKYFGAVEITMIFMRDTQIVDFKKYTLLSPDVIDTNKIEFNFIDQQRFSLPNGIYTLELKIRDAHAGTKPFDNYQEIVVNYPNDEICFSGIQLVESYSKTLKQNILSKSGLDLVPNISGFYPESVKKLSFYSELYNSDVAFGKDSKFLINYFIESYETKTALGNYKSFKKYDAQSVSVVFGEFDISNLPSGNYYLVIEARNRENSLISHSKKFFQRSNPMAQLVLADLSALDVENTFVSKIKTKDSLLIAIACLYPISSEIEKIYADNQVKSNDILLMQRYLYNFWQTRNPVDPGKAFYAYSLEVAKVDHAYKTNIKRGYETDRGRTYLKYGPPNVIADRYNEPSSYPYEIWHYYKLDVQRNKKFVFYNPDLVTNDFELIHSDALGEIANYSWQMLINKRNTVNRDLDEKGGSDHWGSKSEEIFKNPR